MSQLLEFILGRRPYEELIEKAAALDCQVQFFFPPPRKRRGVDGRVQSMSQAGNHLSFRVTNGGSPIPLEFREQIFLPFFRVRPKTPTPGFGLGLPLARAVARAHGGDVEVGSGRPHETEMVLRLPLVMWHQAEAPR